MSINDEYKTTVSLVNSDENKKELSIKIFLFWLIGTFFYLYQSILKVMPSLIANDLMIDLNITAISLGTLGGVYFFSYASLQLPIGILLDRFGVHRLMTVSIILCALGAFLFSLSENLSTAVVARFIIGMGSSGAFIGTIKLLTLWFPDRLIPVLTGLTVLIGSMGSVLGNQPMGILLKYMSWQDVNQLLSIIGFCLAVICFVLIKDHRNHDIKANDFKSLAQGLKHIIKSPQVTLIAIFAFFIYLPLSVLADMWGNSFIQTAYHLSRTDAAECIQMIYFGLAMGAPIFGSIASRYNHYPMIFRIISIAQLPVMIIIIWVHLPNILMLKAAFMVLGLLLGGQALKFNAAFVHGPSGLSGSIVGFVNMICMFGGFIFQQLIGILLHYFWDGTMKDDRIVYTYDAYQNALSIHVIALVVCFVMTFYMKRNKSIS